MQRSRTLTAIACFSCTALLFMITTQYLLLRGANSPVHQGAFVSPYSRPGLVPVRFNEGDDVDSVESALSWGQIAPQPPTVLPAARPPAATELGAGSGSGSRSGPGWGSGSGSGSGSVLLGSGSIPSDSSGWDAGGAAKAWSVERDRRSRGGSTWSAWAVAVEVRSMAEVGAFRNWFAHWRRARASNRLTVIAGDADVLAAVRLSERASVVPGPAEEALRGLLSGPGALPGVLTCALHAVWLRDVFADLDMTEVVRGGSTLFAGGGVVAVPAALVAAAPRDWPALWARLHRRCAAAGAASWPSAVAAALPKGDVHRLSAAAFPWAGVALGEVGATAAAGLPADPGSAALERWGGRAWLSDAAVLWPAGAGFGLFDEGCRPESETEAALRGVGHWLEEDPSWPLARGGRRGRAVGAAGPEEWSLVVAVRSAAELGQFRAWYLRALLLDTGLPLLACCAEAHSWCAELHALAQQDELLEVAELRGGNETTLPAECLLRRLRTGPGLLVSLDVVMALDPLAFLPRQPDLDLVVQVDLPPQRGAVAASAARRALPPTPVLHAGLVAARNTPAAEAALKAWKELQRSEGLGAGGALTLAVRTLRSAGSAGLRWAVLPAAFFPPPRLATALRFPALAAQQPLAPGAPGGALDARIASARGERRVKAASRTGDAASALDEDEAVRKEAALYEARRGQFAAKLSGSLSEATGRFANKNGRPYLDAWAEAEAQALAVEAAMAAAEPAGAGATKANVIAMSLHGDSPRRSKGAVLNAQLVARLMPEWRVRVYVDRSSVPAAVVAALREAGAETLDAEAEAERLGAKPALAALRRLEGLGPELLAALDVGRVERFAVRRPDGRFSARESLALREWVASGRALHVGRDHPWHAYSAFAPLREHAWAGRAAVVAGTLAAALKALGEGEDATAAAGAFPNAGAFLSSTLWPLALRAGVLEHDSHACGPDDRPEARPWPAAREGGRFFGATYPAPAPPMPSGAAELPDRDAPDAGTLGVALEALPPGSACTQRGHATARARRAEPGGEPGGAAPLARPIVAVVTSTRSTSTSSDVLATDLFATLMTSINATVTAREWQAFDVRLYAAYDDDDTFWKTHGREMQALWDTRLGAGQRKLKVRMVECKRVPKMIPWNAVARAAFEDGAEYFLRPNDDSLLVSPGWISLAIDALERADHYGVAGPVSHEANLEILVHDFTNRAHFSVLGYYYPPMFKNWFLDDWITMIYGARLFKFPEWHLTHLVRETRYSVFIPDEQQMLDTMRESRAALQSWRASFVRLRVAVLTVARGPAYRASYAEARGSASAAAAAAGAAARAGRVPVAETHLCRGLVSAVLSSLTPAEWARTRVTFFVAPEPRDPYWAAKEADKELRDCVASRAAQLLVPLPEVNLVLLRDSDEDAGPDSWARLQRRAHAEIFDLVVLAGEETYVDPRQLRGLPPAPQMPPAPPPALLARLRAAAQAREAWSKAGLDLVAELPEPENGTQAFLMLPAGWLSHAHAQLEAGLGVGVAGVPPGTPGAPSGLTVLAREHLFVAQQADELIGFFARAMHQAQERARAREVAKVYSDGKVLVATQPDAGQHLAYVRELYASQTFQEASAAGASGWGLLLSGSFWRSSNVAPCALALAFSLADRGEGAGDGDGDGTVLEMLMPGARQHRVLVLLGEAVAGAGATTVSLHVLARPERAYEWARECAAAPNKARALLAALSEALRVAVLSVTVLPHGGAPGDLRAAADAWSRAADDADRALREARVARDDGYLLRIGGPDALRALDARFIRDGVAGLRAKANVGILLPSSAVDGEPVDDPDSPATAELVHLASHLRAMGGSYMPRTHEWLWRIYAACDRATMLAPRRPLPPPSPALVSGTPVLRHALEYYVLKQTILHTKRKAEHGWVRWTLAPLERSRAPSGLARLRELSLEALAEQSR